VLNGNEFLVLIAGGLTDIMIYPVVCALVGQTEHETGILGEKAK